MKKTLLLFLLLFPVAFVSAQTFTVDNINYTIISDIDHTAEVSTGSTVSGTVDIPSTVTHDGTVYTVTSIGYEAFYPNANITSVTIPNSVTEIGTAAFAYCTSLTSITIPDSVSQIGIASFYGCTNLTSITIPDSVTQIGEVAFCGCTSLTSITIPDSVTQIGESGFYGCTSLTSITIPNSVTQIRDYTFYECTSLTSITIPNSVTHIGETGFYGCISLTSITIPNSVTQIGYGAFNNCTGLTSITIPDSVTEIGDLAFGKCSNLESIICKIESPLEINANVFEFVNRSTVYLKVQATSVSNYSIADVWKDFNISALPTLQNPVFTTKNAALYPNPSSDVVSITLEENAILEKVNVYNTLGQLIKTENNAIIPVHSLSQGAYFFEIISNKGKETKTVLVQ